MLKRAGFHAIACLSNLLPRAVQYRIAHAVGDCCYLFDHNARENVKANIRCILGPDASEKLVRREARWVFRSFGMYLCEFFGHRHFGGDFVDRHVVVQGRENLDAALARGRGAIFCSGHYSNWEMGGTVVGHLGYPIVIVAQMHADAKTNEMFVKQRADFGITVVPTQHGAKGALKALRNNQPVALLGDRPTGGPVVPVTLCGRTTYLPQGPWRIALVTGAPLLPTFVHRRSNENFTLEIGAPIEVPEKGTQRERMLIMAQRWADVFEARLRVDPSQWAAFYRVWDDPKTGALGVSQSLAMPQKKLTAGLREAEDA